jgi:hypothetical protein
MLADGTKIPLILLPKGRIQRYHKQFMIVLLLDQLDARDTRDVQATAEFVNISLIHIPKGGSNSSLTNHEYYCVTQIAAFLLNGRHLIA